MTNLTLPAPSLRQRIWTYIRSQKGKVFYRSDILSTLKLVQSEVDCRYLKALINHGFLEIVSKNPISYRFIKDAGIDTPRFTKDGQLITENTVSEAIWLTMRILKRFTKHDLVNYASTDDRQMKLKNVSSYVSQLKLAGYLRVVDMKGNRETYLLIRDTGPKPPQILRIKEVYDPNLNKIMLREVPENDY